MFLGLGLGGRVRGTQLHNIVPFQGWRYIPGEQKTLKGCNSFVNIGIETQFRLFFPLTVLDPSSLDRFFDSEGGVNPSGRSHVVVFPLE